MRDVTNPPTTRSRRGHLELGLVAVAVLCALLARAKDLTLPFFADDYLFLESVHGKSLLAALVAPDPIGNYFRPVSRQLFFWLIGHAFGESALPFRLVNLALFILVVALVYSLAKRYTGTVGAVAASLFFGLHYAADVPLVWVSGCQDLLAVALALTSLEFLGRDRGWLTFVSALLALLSKEVVAPLPIIGIALLVADGRSFKDAASRCGPLFCASAVWVTSWVAVAAHRSLPTQEISFTAASLPATLVHLFQVTLGMEVRLGGGMFGHWSPASLLPGLLAAALLLLAARLSTMRATHRDTFGSSARALALGSTWALCGAIPVVIVAQTWSAYFFLFALVGASLCLAALVARARTWQGAILLALLVSLSASASNLDEFSTARGPWTMQSHVNRRYVLRALGTITNYLRQLRATHRTLPPRSTLFFANVPTFSGWQAGNGPLVRWAFRDTSLQSYFLTDFTRDRAERGPLFFFVADGESLVDHTNDADLLSSFAYSMLLANRPRQAADALDLLERRQPLSGQLSYQRSWALWAAGDSVRAKHELSVLGFPLERGIDDSWLAVVRESHLDTSAYLAALSQMKQRAVLSPWVHARLASTYLRVDSLRQRGVVEAFIYRTLQPRDADAWRKWASAQLAENRLDLALESLEHYVALDDPRVRQDAEARAILEHLRRVVHGDIAQAALRQ